MPMGLYVLISLADLVAIPAGPVIPAVELTAAELAHADQVIRRTTPDPALVQPPRRADGPVALAEEPPTDLALFVGHRRGGQFEMGALGGGRADAPGLVHVGVGFDF